MRIRPIVRKFFSKTSPILLFGFWALVATAEPCWDCDKKCCTGKGLLHTCLPGCKDACAVHNLACGKIEVSPPGPIGVPPVVINAPPLGQVAAELLTGAMVIKASQTTVNNTVRNLSKAVGDLDNVVKKAADDTKNEAGRTARNISKAADAIKEYEIAETTGRIKATEHALDSVREGKVIDAVWHLGMEPLQDTDKNASNAAMKSDIIRTVGQVAASAYGGPGGAAAYAAWLTFHQTHGDVNLALKVGIITGATAWAMQGAGGVPARDSAGNIVVSDLGKKVAVTAAIGGLAVAAAGGNETAIRDGFLRAGAMVLIQEGYQSYTQHPLNDESMRGAKGPAYCVSSTVNCRDIPDGAAVYKDGKFIGWDQAKLDPSAPHVGAGFPDTPIQPGDVTWPTEGSAFMKGVAVVPGMNAMAVFHDQWAMNWNMPPGILQGTIVPAIVMTYNGTAAPLFERIRVAAEDATGSHSKTGRGQDGAYIVRKDETSTDPVVDSRIDTAYSCAKDDDSRSIAVEVDPSRNTFACRVLYRSNFQRTVPWLARRDIKYCEAMAQGLADFQLLHGYSCYVAFATPMAVKGSGAK